MRSVPHHDDMLKILKHTSNRRLEFTCLRMVDHDHRDDGVLDHLTHPLTGISEPNLRGFFGVIKKRVSSPIPNNFNDLGVVSISFILTTIL